MILGDSMEELDSPVGRVDEDEEEKLLKQAIALSLEGAEEEYNTDKEAQDYGADKEEELLKQAIAVSLEEE